MPVPIIAAFDPFAEDRGPVELALAAGQATGAPVLAVAVYSWGLSEGWSEPYPSPEAEGEVTGAMRRLEQDLGVETRVLRAQSVPAALHQLQQELGAGLIVVGSTDRGPTGRVMTGSTAQRLLHGAPCPVVVAPRDYRPGPLKTIAVGFVDTAEGRAALRAAHLLARRSEARLRVVAALHPWMGPGEAFSAGGKRERASQLKGHHRAQVEAALQRAIDQLEPGVETEPELHVDDAADVLLRVSRNADLLVCGSRGYGPMRSVLLGGVSRRLVDEADCPVLVLPRDARQPLEDLVGLTEAVARP